MRLSEGAFREHGSGFIDDMMAAIGQPVARHVVRQQLPLLQSGIPVPDLSSATGGTCRVAFARHSPSPGAGKGWPVAVS